MPLVCDRLITIYIINCQYDNSGAARRFPVISRLSDLFPGFAEPPSGRKPLRNKANLPTSVACCDFYPVFSRGNRESGRADAGHAVGRVEPDPAQTPEELGQGQPVGERQWRRQQRGDVLAQMIWVAGAE